MRGYAGIGLHSPVNDLNIGGALRAAACYGIAFVAISNKRYGKAPTDTGCAYRHMPLLQVDDLGAMRPYDCVPVAVDLVPQATSLWEYKHPERAFYIFGPENGTLGRDTLDWCRDVVSIPTHYCMNLAACVNVVLYDRQSKYLAGM